MRNPLNCLLISLTLLVGCKGLEDVEIAKKEVCVYSDESDRLQCTDRSLPEPQQEYSREIEGGDIVTNHDDFIQGINEVIQLKEELKRCQGGSRL